MMFEAIGIDAEWFIRPWKPRKRLEMLSFRDFSSLLPLLLSTRLITA
jgi:hypothetical protein